MRRMERESEPFLSFTVERFGEGVYKEYRIPGIVVTDRKTVICCYEGRMDTHNDWAQIDIIIGRSTDGGRNITKQVLPGRDLAVGEHGPVTWNNPVLIADHELVHLIFHKNYETAYYCCSNDDGVTFSEPRDITEAFREFPRKWNVCASGPGHGIVTEGGRLLVPVWIADGKPLDGTGRKKAHNPSVAGAIYSDDRGKTWHAGQLISGVNNANETAAAEIGGGRILYNFRNCEPEKCRVTAISPDGVSGFGQVLKETALPDPGCFGSMARSQRGDLYFINCANGDLRHPLGERIFLTCYVSGDDGVTWRPYLLADTYGGYADLAIDGKLLYVFYEQSVWRKEEKRVNQLILKQYRLDAN